jgi:hypothetical protein
VVSFMTTDRLPRQSPCSRSSSVAPSCAVAQSYMALGLSKGCVEYVTLSTRTRQSNILVSFTRRRGNQDPTHNIPMAKPSTSHLSPDRFVFKLKVSNVCRCKQARLELFRSDAHCREVVCASNCLQRHVLAAIAFVRGKRARVTGSKD